jgi:hypothetical protein
VLKSLIAHARRVTPAQRDAPVGEWVAESNRLAREVALAYPGFACDHVPAQPVLLSDAYQKRARRVITLQIALAGARLAAIINRVLGSSSSAPPLPQSAQGRCSTTGQWSMSNFTPCASGSSPEKLIVLVARRM